MRIGSMFFHAPTPEAAEPFLADCGLACLEISLPIRADPIIDTLRRNILACGRAFPGRVALHEVLPMALTHRQESFRAQIRDRLRSRVHLAAEAGIGLFTLHTTATRTVRSLEATWMNGETRWLTRAMDLDVSASFAESVAALVELLRELGPIARDGGVTLALENNFRDQHFFHRRLDSVADILSVLDQAQAPNVGMCFDIFKATSTESSIPAAIRAAGRRIVNVHASDIAGDMVTSFGRQRRAVGEGRINWEEALAALAAIGYDGPIILEMMHTAEDIRTSAQRLHRLLAKGRTGAGGLEA